MTLLLGLVPAAALAAPETTAVSPSGEQSVTVEIAQPTPSIAPDGDLSLSVAVTTAAPADYLEVRVRLRSPSGRIVYQKTEVRSALMAGRHTIPYERSLAPLDLTQGRYPIEVRVLATGADPTTAHGRLLVVDPKTPVVPVAVVVAATDVPAVTMSGRFARDPAGDTHLRDDLAYLMQLALSRREPLALAIPPVLIEQMGRAAAGYETTAGVVVPTTDEQVARYGRVLETLRSSVATGTIDLIDVPYALPDLAGLAEIAGLDDVARHWAQTDTVNALVLHSATKPTAAYLGPDLTTSAFASLAERGVSCVLAEAGALRSGDTTAAPGCYTVGDGGVKVLVVDTAAAAGARAGADEFYDALFDRLEGGPVVVMLQIGPGAPNTAADVQHALDWIDDASWLRLSDIPSLARRGTEQKASIVRPGDSTAPSSYWTDIASARPAALAYADAAGLSDPDAAAAVRAILAAESSLWAGGDGAWSAHEEGRARAAEAFDFVNTQYSLIRLDSKDVTLSGSKGDVPLTLINDTGKPLKLTLHAISSTGLSVASTQEILVQPTQNFLTLPVDLGNTLADEFEITVRAGDVTVAEATVGVRASYIDRLATILMVVIVLGVLLVIIRRRVGTTVADTIVQEPRRPRRVPRTK